MSILPDTPPIEQQSSSEQSGKEHSSRVFNDPIHGTIDVHPLCARIIDTPQFQRLRYLRQLGGCYFVYPGASHNRFEHCLGVYHLAGELINNIRARQPQLDITDEDVLCVQIAGLCHDLGHGPFSHMFDRGFLPSILKSEDKNKSWQHEKGSVDMFKHLVSNKDLQTLFKEFKLTDDDIIFIEEQIAGPLYRDKKNQQNWPYKGREKKKSFLYEIVANKRNGIDVDKWDYFARDSRYLGVNTNFDHTRFIKFSRVIDHDGEMQICTRDKEVNNVYDMFYTRCLLHQRAYQHKTKEVIETMIIDAMIAANEFIRLPGKDGKMLKMSECIDDMEAYTRLTDNVYHQMLYSTSEELRPARHILQKIERRQLYKCIGKIKHKDEKKIFDKKDISGWEQKIAEASVDKKLKAADLFIITVNIDYGKKDENPIDHVRFYTKDDPDKAITISKDQVSKILPERFRDQHIRLYCRKCDRDTIDNATKCLWMWCKNNDMTDPKESQ